jgi:hypothetical protein
VDVHYVGSVRFGIGQAVKFDRHSCNKMADEAFYLEFVAWTIGGIDQAFSKGAKTVTVARVQAGGLFCGAKAVSDLTSPNDPRPSKSKAISGTLPRDLTR